MELKAGDDNPRDVRVLLYDFLILFIKSMYLRSSR